MASDHRCIGDGGRFNCKCWWWRHLHSAGRDKINDFFSLDLNTIITTTSICNLSHKTALFFCLQFPLWLPFFRFMFFSLSFVLCSSWQDSGALQRMVTRPDRASLRFGELLLITQHVCLSASMQQSFTSASRFHDYFRKNKLWVTYPFKKWNTLNLRHKILMTFILSLIQLQYVCCQRVWNTSSQTSN